MTNRKEFISKTLTFIANSLFINLFSKVFGMDNTMVAVSIVVVALTLTAIDMNQDLIKRCFLVTLLMLIITTGAALATIHPLLGLIINFIIILGIVNQLFDHYRGSYYFPFLISYIFLLMSSPVTPIQLPRRAFSVVLGCIYVFLIQWLFNRHRYKQTMISLETTVINNLNKQIIKLQQQQKDSSLYHKVNSMIPILIKSIDDNKLQNNTLSSLNKGYTQLIILLDNLNQLLYHMDLNTINLPGQEDFLLRIKELLQLMKDYINSPPTEKQQLLLQMKVLIDNLELCHYSQEISCYVLALKKLTPSLLPLTDDTKVSHQKYPLMARYNWRNYNFLSYHFKFALKLALPISLTIFLIEIFHITYGRWIIFPMIAIIQPYYDNTLEKAKHRVRGTFLGILLFTLLFTFIKNPTLRLNLTILTAYIGIFITKYQYSTALVAISALGSSALQGGGVEILFYRILFTVLGCFISMIINRYIYHYNKANIQEDLLNELLHIEEELHILPNVACYENKKYHLLIEQKLIECKLRTL